MPKTAVVQEWIASHGGSENVAEAMATALDADVFTLWREDPSRFTQFPVHESPLARSRFVTGHKALALPLMPLTWRRTDLSAYDRVVVSSHLFAHQVLSAPQNRASQAFVYVHTPGRYIWAPDFDHRGRSWWVRAASKPLQRLDRARVPRGASFAANSEFVRRRIQSAWDVDARVIHPPVNVATIQAGMPWADHISSSDAGVLTRLPSDFVLGASRFVSYKRLDAVLDVGTDLGLPVVLAGTGPDRAALDEAARSAKVPVHFVERPSTPLLYALYEAAALFVFAAIEDFGIMPVEAMATGTPVLVNETGGARESVGLTGGGQTTDFQSGAARRAAAERALQVDAEKLRVTARSLDAAEFTRQMRSWVDDTEIDRMGPS